MEDEIYDEAGDANPPPLPKAGDFQMPPIEELLKALERMEGLTEENKQELRESLLARANQENPDFFNAARGVPQQAPAPDLLILFLFLTVILFVFVFFGYKLYKSLAERERRKEEKKRQKQQKKKK